MAIPSQPPAEERVVESDTFELEVFWHKHGKTVLAAVVVVVAAVVATGVWFYKSHQDLLAAEQLFAQSQNPDGWRELITKYPKSAPAADAYFLLAEAQREQGNFEESSKTYQSFLDSFPKHPLVGGARLGLAQNLELTGKDADAMNVLRDLQVQNSGYAAPYAAMVEGRILLRQGKLAEARKVLSNLLQSYPSAPETSFAAAMIQQIDALAPAPVQAPVAQPEASPAKP